MKKLAKILTVLILALSLSACGENNTNKYLEDGKNALANEQYEQAFLDFKAVLHENKDNEEAITLSNIVLSYLQAKKYYDDDNFYLAKKALDNIDPSYTQYKKLKENIDSLKSKIDEALS
ncbi:hypothetical protein [Clostridium tarantellae]|uniref:Tetratricopeptide repeat protein n=1 Tax=Clostridium tarantellae TaxID=39493 RepID=A0A6I1MLZ9_9CLOT|nr:hypothetical protein [Clostridium tarantellae]MPQ44034.1 hypothetical protein [Clostridium tarantellae]